MKNAVYVLDTALLDDKELFDKWYMQMPQQRREKIDSFRREDDKKRSLGAGILLNKLLEKEGMSARQLRTSVHGKPFVEGDPFYFSISHSAGFAVCAASDKTVGVDIEKIRHFRKNLADRVFTVSEREYINEHAAHQRDKSYTYLWTIKESVMKYLGTGLSIGPENICIDFTGQMSACCDGYDLCGLRFTRYEIIDCVMTVCSAYSSFANEPEMLDISEL